MTGFLVDTNVISELRKGARADAGVRDWFEAAPSDQLFLSVLVVGELRRGVELIRRRDSVAAEHLDAWLMRIRTEFAEHILPVTEEIAEVWGGLSLTAPLPPIDGLLAATAIHHQMTLVTRNEKDVSRTPARVFNPFHSSR